LVVAVFHNANPSMWRTRQDGVLHFRGYRSIGPLGGVELGRIELVDGKIGIRPIAGVGEDSEMDEHSEAQVDVRALQVFEAGR
jgi:hypothetical protein